MSAIDQRNHWPFLDFVRAGAALLVMLGHARGFFFPEFATLADPGLLTKAFYLVTGLQHEGVVLFFLVSGFLVGGSAWEAFDKGQFEPLRYLGNRFVRIYLVLIPGLLLTLAIHAVGMFWLSDTRSFAALPAQPWSWAVGICHLACLQGISCSVVFANSPLWSLSYEWLLYLIAPLVLAVAYSELALGWRTVAILVVASILTSVLPAHLQWSWVVFWAAGATARRVYALRPVDERIGVLGLFGTVSGMLLSRLQIWPLLATDLLIAATFWFALTSPAVLARTPARRVLGFLADCSYSLYVIHLPVILLTAALLESYIGSFAIGAGPVQFSFFAVTVAVALAAAVIFAHATERWTRPLQQVLISHRTDARVHQDH